jgi:molybdopterin/thiamine biosynthesis adenylyltransferase
MKTFRFRALETQIARITAELFKDENEAAAIVLCGRSTTRDPWLGGEVETFLLKEIIPVPADAYASRTPFDFTWSTTPFFRALKLAEPKDFGVAVFHSHPSGCPDFSTADDVAEKELFEIAFNRLECRRPHLSVVIDRDTSIRARAYGPDLKPIAAEIAAIIGERWKFVSGSVPVIGNELDRQVRAFGSKATETLSQLRVGIVGCGGTGSAVAMLLARIGIRKLALIDADITEHTNLNRVHFATMADANLARRKVDVIGEAIAALGMPISIVRIPHFVDHTQALATLRSCDVIFGCTDDHLGREILNRLAHFYFIPVIDLGLRIEPNDQGGYDVFDGRVTVVQPGYPCQTCRGLIKGDRILLDSLRRDPELLEQRRAAGYVPNDPDPSPAVVTFTTEVATMAVNELFHRLNGIRGSVERCSEHVRQFQYLKDADSLPGGKSRPECRICGQRRYDGRGDMSPLLDLSL